MNALLAAQELRYLWASSSHAFMSTLGEVGQAFADCGTDDLLLIFRAWLLDGRVLCGTKRLLLGWAKGELAHRGLDCKLREAA